MSDRYRDRHDSYDEGRYDYYDDPYADSGRYRSSSSADNPYADSTQRTASSYSRHSGAYHAGGSSRSSSGAGAYADNRNDSNAGQQYGQGGYGRRSQNVFEDYYPEEATDSYRRSSYGSGAAQSAGSRRSYGSSRPAAHGRTPSSQKQYEYAQSQQGYAQNQYDYAQGQRATRTPRSHAAVPAGRNADYAPKRSHRKRNIIIVAVAVLAVVLIGAGAAWAYIHSIDENLHKGVTQETLEALEPAEGQMTKTALGEAPFYMLFMGVDMAEWRRELAEYAGDQWGRSDSMILARIDPVNKKVALISIHRDTMVDLGEYGQQKINAAYEFYGPAGAIKAVSTMAGVPISHYATVDFDGFAAIVDSLGGLEVNVPMEINDEVMPAHLDAGLQTLNGDQALILCRSRHSYDDVANDGDVMRAANQRMVLGALAKKVLSSDIMTIASTVTTLSKYVTTDLSVSDIVGLAQLFQGVNPDTDIYTAMEPTTSAYINETWYEYLDEASWKEMVSRMDQGLPPVNKTEIDERTGTILSTGGADAPVV